MCVIVGVVKRDQSYTAIIHLVEKQKMPVWKCFEDFFGTSHCVSKQLITDEIRQC